MFSAHEILKLHGIKLKKGLGQHFLCAMPTAEKIVRSMKMAPDDLILEIGPGPGIMTQLIAPVASRIFAVDADAKMLDIAKLELSEHDNIEFIHKDILDLDLGPNLNPNLNDKRLRILGNLPYNISSQIIFWMIDNREHISDATIMIQKEVAQRLCAEPGGKEYGVLSVLTQAFASCKKLFDVSPRSFVPPPKVWSSVVRMDLSHAPHEIADEDAFRLVVKTAFQKRRKTIKNSLSKFTGIEEALDKCDIAPSRRPETLSVQDFIDLSGALLMKETPQERADACCRPSRRSGRA
jgi:16S rRNA (adenine1518-N6/adenine1519-N6)-dimethyltransferase